MTQNSSLAVFDARIQAWFARRYGQPTEVQSQTWPFIAAGRHVLATAPTGSGKTLAAFLWALDRLATRTWEGGGVRVLYVSPLKALNNDVQKNLLDPLAELAEGVFGKELPEIDVGVRSGDTPQSERRRMLRRPPEILVTTPESLSLLLSSRGGRAILPGVKTVILDEIHAVAGNKRGTYLMTAVERLAALAGEFQRVALSATVRPLDTIAAFVGGFSDDGAPRPVQVVRSGETKRLEVTVCATERDGATSAWPPLVARFREVLDANRATLFFVNNRALSERLVRWINADEEAPVAYAHHGSLARELRALVEKKLKAGSLKALVATSSLELGIDVGHLDEVVLVQSPRTLASGVQRVGRAGHGVGETSRGRIYPTHPRDFLDAAVLAPLIETGASEALHPVRSPLDVLAQVVCAMCAVEEWDLDTLFDLLRRSWPYRTLRKEAFDRVVAMLRGRYADTRLRELRPRLRIDPASGRVRGAAGVPQLVYRSGGVIPDRGYFTARMVGGGRLGELDEEFVWERRIGQEITIGAQTWKIERVTRNEVLVGPGSGRVPAIPPFWKAEAHGRDFELCEHIGEWLERADRGLDDDALAHLDEMSRDALLEFLRRQKEATRTALPHRRHLLVEDCRSMDAGSETRSVVLHATWGDRVLRPWTIAMAAAWEEQYGYELETFANDDCVLVQLPRDCPARRALDLVAPERIEELLRLRLERTGFFGTRFRENAMRALLLPRHRGRDRTPLWLNRIRAQKLLQAVARYEDFPIVAETWRTCLEDEFDLETLRRLLDEVRTGAITVSETATPHPSPFAEGVAWRATNQAMYDQNERAAAAGPSSLGERVLQEVLHDSALRPRLDPALVGTFESKLQRTAPGYAPADAAEWVDLVEERLLVPPWTEELPPGLEIADWGRPWVVSSAQRPRLERARAGDDRALAQAVGLFLQCHGPVSLAYLVECWGVEETRLRDVLDRLVDDGRVLADRFRAGAAETEFCDAENLERLLRQTRAAARPVFEPLPLDRLAPFLAGWQGLCPRGESVDDLRTRLETLFGYAAPAALWEEAVLPARFGAYQPAWLDSLLQESDLVWFGAGQEQVGFAFRQDARLFLPPPDAESEILPDAPGRYDFFELQKLGGLDSTELAQRLWAEAWEGRLVNDAFAALRRGVETGFRPAAATSTRRGLSRWQSTRPLVGSWHALERAAAADPLEEAEDNKERARQLLARYGVVFRELCGKELPPLRWARVLKALRLMELSGEVVAGCFFAGVEGLQFASHDAFRRLRARTDDDAVFWLNACDPASLCGCGLELDLPARVASTWLVYRGRHPVLIARRGGRHVELRGPPDECVLEVFRDRLARSFRPPARIVIEEIDGAAAAASGHAEVFSAAGFYADRKELVLERRYT